MSFNAIRENNVLAKLSEFTVVCEIDKNEKRLKTALTFQYAYNSESSCQFSGGILSRRTDRRTL